MQNWYALESEAEHRRLEWNRAVAADARAILAFTERTTPTRVPLPHKSLKSFNLRRLVAQGMSLITSITSCKCTSKIDSTVQLHRAS
jgi:hypothetical protein